MVRIQTPHLHRTLFWTRLAARVTAEDWQKTLWFAVPRRQENGLASGRADAFVLALLPFAMRGGHDLSCEGPISGRLRFQLNDYLIPALASAGDLCQQIRIIAPAVAERYPTPQAVGAGFGLGLDALYTVMRHSGSCEFPLTHLIVPWDTPRERYWQARRFASARGLKLLPVASNLDRALPESPGEVQPFRELARALALQNLFSVYLLSCEYDAAHFRLDLENAAAFNLLTAACVCTESLSIYPSGVEARREDKLAALKDWPAASRWLDVKGRDGVPVPPEELTDEERRSLEQEAEI